MAKGEWNEIPFAFENRMEQKWITAGAKKCLGPGLLCRLRCALMRQISSAVALLIFNPGNIRPGKSGTEISMDVWVGYLYLSLVPASFLGVWAKPVLCQLYDNIWLTQWLSFTDMILDWKDRPRIQRWENSIFLLYSLTPGQWSSNHTSFTVETDGLTYIHELFMSKLMTVRETHTKEWRSLIHLSEATAKWSLNRGVSLWLYCAQTPNCISRLSVCVS